MCNKYHVAVILLLCAKYSINDVMLLIIGMRHQPLSESVNPQLLMAQDALRGNIQEGLAVATETESNLYSADSLPPLGSDSVSHTPSHTHSISCRFVTRRL